MAKGLTEKQRKILEFVIDFQKEHGFPPTIRETGDAFGIGSLRGVTVHLDALVRKGCLSRDRTSRSIKVIAPDPRVPMEELDAVQNALLDPMRLRQEMVLCLPLLRGFGKDDADGFTGKISAGDAIIERYIPIPDELAGAATVDGFVMRVGATGIYGEPSLPGDLLVVRPQHKASRGELVVLLAHNDLTVRRYTESAPDDVTSMVTEAPEIIGRVVGLIRRY